MPLHLTRTYVKHWAGRGIFGRNWLSNFDYSLAPQTAGGQNLLWLQNPDGRRIKFIFSAPLGRWQEEKPQPVAYIVRDANGNYTHFNENSGTERYNADGYITERRNEQGVKWTFLYSGKYLQKVTHSSGRHVRFVWSGSQVVQVIAPNNATFSYTYSPNVFGVGLGRLSSTIRPGEPSSTVAYHYEDSRFADALTGKSIDGERYSWTTYDAAGRAASTHLYGGAQKYMFAYAIQASEQVTPPPAPPPPGGYQDGGDRGWCEYQSGQGPICYQPLASAPAPAAAGKVISATSNPSTKPRPTVFQTTVTNPLNKKTIYRFQDAKLISVEGVSSPHVAANYRELTYDSNGYLDLVTDFKDAVTNFDYDAQGHLLRKVEAVGQPEARTALYVWDLSKHRILKETLVGDFERSFEYDAQGRVRSTTEKNLSATGVVNQARTTSYVYSVGSNGLVSQIVADGPLAGAGDAVTRQFDAEGDPTSVTNGLGHAQTFSGHNGFGFPGRVRGANGEATDFSYDSLGRVRSATQVRHGITAVTSYEYDAAGLLVATISPDGHTRHLEYDRAHRPSMEFEPAGDRYHTRRYEYNAMSLPIVIQTGTSEYRPDTEITGLIDGVYQGPNGAYVSGWACSLYFDNSVNVHLYVGGSAGSGTIITGITANLQSEPQVAQACRASGGAYRFSFDIESQRAAHGGKKIYIHGISPVGRGNSLIGRSGVFVVPPITTPPPPPPPVPPFPPRECGTGRCVEPIIAPVPEAWAAEPELSALATPVPHGTLETSIFIDYDEEGRIRGTRGNDGEDARYTYDANGNPETLRDSLSRVTNHNYDRLNRLIMRIDPKLQATEFKYDSGDRLVRVKDPRGLTTSYQYDGFSQLWSQTSPDTGTTTFEYDSAGRQTKLRRNDGSYVNFAYDQLGRVTTASAPGLARDYNYDNCSNSTYAAGRLCSVNLRDPNSVLAHSLFYYFPHGELQARHDVGSGANDVTRYGYDGMGRLKTLTYPSGAVAHYGYSHGRLDRLTATLNGGTYNIATEIKHQPYGPIKSWVYGNGLVRNYNFNLDGRLTGISSASGGALRQSLTYARDPNGLIEAVTNGLDAAQSHNYVYDELGRLTKDFVGGSTIGMFDQFDATGNRVSRGNTAPGSAPASEYAISPTSNQLVSQTGAVNRNFFYSPNGNLASTTGWQGNRTYGYDAFERLRSTTVDGVTTSYLVNALDQRVRKSGPLGTFRYVYAGQNTLLAEHDGEGATGWKNFLYLGDEPVAMISGNLVRYFVHTDHLGRPEAMTDAAKNTVWKAVNVSYTRTVTVGDPDGLKIGFPGQYWDEETRTWHNGFRDYDPYTGRYIQSDPIGLGGGLNTYVYADANPVNFIDPLGLASAPRDRLPRPTPPSGQQPIHKPGLPNPVSPPEARPISRFERTISTRIISLLSKGLLTFNRWGQITVANPYAFGASLLLPRDMGYSECEMPGGRCTRNTEEEERHFGKVGELEDISDQLPGRGGGSGGGGPRGGGGSGGTVIGGGCYGLCGRTPSVTVRPEEPIPPETNAE